MSGALAFAAAVGGCSVDHAAVKLDDRAWRRLTYVGVMNIPADETGPAEALEMRNCGECHSTLCKSVPVNP